MYAKVPSIKIDWMEPTVEIQSQRFCTRDNEPNLHFEGLIYALEVTGPEGVPEDFKITLNGGDTLTTSSDGLWDDLSHSLTVSAATDKRDEKLALVGGLSPTVNFDRIDRIILTRGRPGNTPINIKAFSYNIIEKEAPPPCMVMVRKQTFGPLTDYDPELYLNDDVFAMRITGPGDHKTQDYIIRVNGKYDLFLNGDGTWAKRSPQAQKMVDGVNSAPYENLKLARVPLFPTVNFSRLSKVRLVRPNPTVGHRITVEALSYHQVPANKD